MPSASPTSFIMTNSKHLGVCEIHDYKKKNHKTNILSVMYQ